MAFTSGSGIDRMTRRSTSRANSRLQRSSHPQVCLRAYAERARGGLPVRRTHLSSHARCHCGWPAADTIAVGKRRRQLDSSSSGDCRSYHDERKLGKWSICKSSETHHPFDLACLVLIAPFLSTECRTHRGENTLTLANRLEKRAGADRGLAEVAPISASYRPQQGAPSPLWRWLLQVESSAPWRPDQQDPVPRLRAV